MSDRRRFLKGLTSIPLAPEESLLMRIPGKLISQSGASRSVIPAQDDQRSERSDAG